MATRSRGGDQSQGLPRLPPGRHGLPRDFVVSNQRDRLAAGTITAIAQNGYHETTVSHIVEAAGVSRRTFYQYFGSKEECFIATYQVVEEFLLGEMRSAGEATERCPDRFCAQVEAGLAVFAANPDLALFLLAAPQSAGGEALERYRGLLGAVQELLKENLTPASPFRQPGAAVDDGLAGGISSLIVGSVRAGEGKRLASRLDEIVELVLTPYLGSRAAADAIRGSAL